MARRSIRDILAHIGMFEFMYPGSVSAHRLMTIVLEHDTYHAGEINRTRALLQNDDDWPDHSG
ncbi:MAG: hypothetical protein O3B95_03825 [Chloroflexi bacterium]|nr:hypothetical protein [Chloroflexota bacterium]